MLTFKITGSVKISENGADAEIEIASINTKGDTEDTGPMSTLLSKVRHFENVENETIVIAGKLQEETVTERTEVAEVITGNEEWEPMVVTGDMRDYGGDREGSETAGLSEDQKINTTTITRSTLEQFDQQSLKDRVQMKEDYKVSSSLSGRPKFHVIDVSDFPQDTEIETKLHKKESREIKDGAKIEMPKILKKQARFDIEEKELTFPNFETQFFGSFGELSQNYDSSKFGTDAGSYNEPGHISGGHSGHTPHRHQGHHQLGHHGPDVHSPAPHHPHPHPPPHPPKRAVVSHHSPQLIKDTYSGGKPADSITSALYVEDPWKNIDKVSII